MQFHIGPALGRLRLPLGPTFVSAILHVILLGVVIFGASMWTTDRRTKPVYVVLAPATAAIGSPKGVTMPPPPKVEEAPAPKPAPPAELPRRDVARDLPARDLPARDLPARDLPARDLPARDAVGLPDRKSLPLPAAPTRPRPDEKELPRVASTTPAATPTPAPARPEASASPPPPLGAATGSASGAGPLTLNVSDFPYAYYLRQVTEKIREKWNGRAIPGSQPIVVFEIRRDGRLNLAAIEKSSGNTAYDQVALRALNDAGPFPPLPDDFKKPVLRIGLQFGFDPTGG